MIRTQALPFDVDSALKRALTPLAVIEAPSAIFVAANSAFAAMLRVDSARLATLDIFSFIADDERPVLEALLAGVVSGRTVSYQGRSRWRRGDGEVLDVLTSMQPLDSDGPPTRALLAAVPAYQTAHRLWAPLPAGVPSPVILDMVEAAMPIDDERQREGVAERASRLEGHLWRVALEIEASGIGGSTTGAMRVAGPELIGLSDRQSEIVRRVLRGERAPAIARDLFISPSTVRNHLSTIYRRLGVHSQSELLALLLPVD